STGRLNKLASEMFLLDFLAYGELPIHEQTKSNPTQFLPDQSRSTKSTWPHPRGTRSSPANKQLGTGRLFRPQARPGPLFQGTLSRSAPKQPAAAAYFCVVCYPLRKGWWSRGESRQKVAKTFCVVASQDAEENRHVAETWVRTIRELSAPHLEGERIGQGRRAGWAVRVGGSPCLAPAGRQRASFRRGGRVRGTGQSQRRQAASLAGALGAWEKSGRPDLESEFGGLVARPARGWS
uniref:Uncharacterized protein n=1 Tax=Laticauda laticaudata TaxID=8630 RepID=A0A8C5SWJ5_LATLA